METSMAYYQTRLATFQGKAAAKSRRTSSKSKKAAPKSKGAWPLSSPTAEDLAYAGFVFAPTSASFDNVQCWACNCQLDGWEEADVPLYEHVTHSPNCGFAVVTAIRLRHGDPARTEEDPTSDAMVAARIATFADLWPLDVAAGYPSVEQLAAAGWCYDPAEDMPDGVTCPYCHLALDAWDSGDDPLEEHRRRQSDCLFFSLAELYHPTSKPEPKGKAKRTTKGKRASSRSSTASSATAATKKTTRGKYGASEPIEDDTDMSELPTKATRGRKRGSAAVEDLSSMSIEPAKKTRGKKRASEAVEDASSMSVAPAKKTRGKKRISEATDDASSMSVLPKKNTRGKKRISEATDDASSMSVLPKKNTRGKKRASEAVEEVSSMSVVTKKTTRGKKRASEAVEEASSMSVLPTKSTRGKKRTSEAVEEDIHMTESQHDSSKRMRFSSVSSFPDDLPAGTPKRIPTELETQFDSQPFTMSSFPSNLLVGTPKRQVTEQAKTPFTMSSLPPDLLVGTPKRTPPHLRKDQEPINIWQPVDVETFPANQQAVRGFFNDIMIDAGLDALTMDGTTAEEIQAAVLAGLMDAEKGMTIEQWVMYNAKRGEEKLREACEQQVSAFEAEGKRALATLEAIPTY